MLEKRVQHLKYSSIEWKFSRLHGNMEIEEGENVLRNNQFLVKQLSESMNYGQILAGVNEDGSLQWSNGRRSRNATMVGTSSPQKHIHCSDWREMLELVEAANAKHTEEAKILDSNVSF